MTDRQKLLEAISILRDLVDPDPCEYDHHGYCQTHGWMAIEPKCPHARAKEFLSTIEETPEMTEPIRNIDDLEKFLREAHKVQKAMLTYGGSFMRALAQAMDYADSNNLRKIRDCWADEWDKYKEVGERIYSEEAQL